MAEAIKRSGNSPTREKVVHELENMRDFDIGGIKVSFSKTDHQALKKVFVYYAKSGKFELVNE